MIFDRDWIVSVDNWGISNPCLAIESVPATPAPPLMAMRATRFPGGGGHRRNVTTVLMSCSKVSTDTAPICLRSECQILADPAIAALWLNTARFPSSVIPDFQTTTGLSVAQLAMAFRSRGPSRTPSM